MVKTTLKDLSNRDLEITSLLTEHSIVVVAFKLVGAQTRSALFKLMSKTITKVKRRQKSQMIRRGICKINILNNDHLKESASLLNMTFPHLKHAWDHQHMCYMCFTVYFSLCVTCVTCVYCFSFPAFWWIEWLLISHFRLHCTMGQAQCKMGNRKMSTSPLILRGNVTFTF